MPRKMLSRWLFPILVASVFFASCGGNGDGKVNLSWKETASNAQKSFDVKILRGEFWKYEWIFL